MPLEEEGIPLSKLYAPVLIEENETVQQNTRQTNKNSDKQTLDNISDMFYVYVNGKHVRKLAKKVFLKGEAGHGKTVFCLNIIDAWSKAMRSKGNWFSYFFCCRQISGHESTDNEHKEDGDLLRCLRQFDATFYVPLRDAKPEVLSVVDLVCNSVYNQTERTKQKIRTMLGDKKVRCLIILDGLDDWKVESSSTFPDTDALANNVLLCTMRPWRIVKLPSKMDSTPDKVVQILGLQIESVEKVINNIFVHFYSMDRNLDEYKKIRQTFELLSSKARESQFKSLMQIPLMLTACCIVLKEESEISKKSIEVSSFMTFFYLKLLEIKIARANIKHQNQFKSFLCEKRRNSDSSQYIPHIVSEFSHIMDFLEIIIPIGRLALEGLVSDETHLVVPTRRLESVIGNSVLELAMHIGILSESKAPGDAHQKKVNLSFFHKTFQEFMAALVIACGDEKAFDQLFKNCTSVDNVIQMSNTITFLFGLNPEKEHRISDHIRTVIDNDSDIIQYREKPVLHHLDSLKSLFFFEKRNSAFKVIQLNEMRIKWQEEMKRNILYTQLTHRQLVSIFTDVCLDNNSDKGVVSMTREVVLWTDNSINSLWLDCVAHSVYDILNHLPVCHHLTSIYIRNMTDKKDRTKLADILPQLKTLQHVLYSGDLEREDDTDDTVVHALLQLNALKCIELENIRLLNDVPLTRIPLLEAVVLKTLENAYLIIPSLFQCRHLKYIGLINTYTLPPFQWFLNSELRQDTIKSPENIPLLENATQLETFVFHNVVSHDHIISFLRFCTELTTLNIAMLDKENSLSSVLPLLKNLQYIRYKPNRSSPRKNSADVVGALQTLTNLKHIELKRVDLCHGNYGPSAQTNPNVRFRRKGRTLRVKKHMTQLTKISLKYVDMSGKGWTKFVSSLLGVPQTVDVILSWTNISDDAVSIIEEDRRFKVTQLSKERINGVTRSRLKTNITFSKTNYSSSMVRDTK